MNNPTVSIICLVYNHAQFVNQCLESVCQQSYAAWELIIVDDASTDSSAEQVRNFIKGRNGVQFLQLSQNIGSCKAFNLALRQAKGKYVMDLAADDSLFPHCLETLVRKFEQLDQTYGIVFADALLVRPDGSARRTFYKRNSYGKLLQNIPSGYLYEQILQKNIVCTPSMLMRKTMLDQIGGYNEALAYEDFDLWVRTSRQYAYAFTDAVVVRKRLLDSGLSQQFYRKRHNTLLASTLQICQYAAQQNTNIAQNLALAVCIRYHWRMSCFTQNYAIAQAFAQLLRQIKVPITLHDRCLQLITRLKIPLWQPYRCYLWVRFGKKIAPN